MIATLRRDLETLRRGEMMMMMMMMMMGRRRGDLKVVLKVVVCGAVHY